MKKKALFVDDDWLKWLESLKYTLEDDENIGDVEIVPAANGKEAFNILEKDPTISLVLLDLIFYGDENAGFEILKEMKSRDSKLPVIMLTVEPSHDIHSECMNSGAYDYFVKSEIDPIRFRMVVRNALRAYETLQEKEVKERDLNRSIMIACSKLDSDILREHTHFGMVGMSSEMKKIFRRVEKIAKDSGDVLILGKTGTGKELVARAIHEESLRGKEKFIRLNCPNVPKDLQESEMFGHEKGAFTGATGRHIGMFEQAAGGTLFLDEIGDMDLGLQAKLLTAIEHKTFRRIKGKEDIKVDIRIIAATNKNLKEEIEKGEFRMDLFYRLYVMPIELPTLEERKEDIPLLVNYFASRYSREKDKNIVGIKMEVLEYLTDKCGWPGNVRELQNVVRETIALIDRDMITLDALPERLLPPTQDVQIVSLSQGQKESQRSVEYYLEKARASEQTGKLLFAYLEAVLQNNGTVWGVLVPVREALRKEFNCGHDKIYEMFRENFGGYDPNVFFREVVDLKHLLESYEADPKAREIGRKVYGAPGLE